MMIPKPMKSTRMMRKMEKRAPLGGSPGRAVDAFSDATSDMGEGVIARMRAVGHALPDTSSCRGASAHNPHISQIRPRFRAPVAWKAGDDVPAVAALGDEMIGRPAGGAV